MDQQLRLGRIVLEDAQASHQQVTIDLVFQGNDVKGGIEYFGIWRDRSEGGICPFILNENGEADSAPATAATTASINSTS
jgi:hypothetical protein